MSIFGKMLDSAFSSQKFSKVTQVMVPGGTGVTWPTKRYDMYAKEAYLTQVISYRCIDEIARAMESVRWKLVERDEDGQYEEITEHPVVDLMYRPNQEEHWGQIMYRWAAFILITGNAYMEKIPVGKGESSKVKEIWVHRSDRMKVIVNPPTGLKIRFEYTGPGGKVASWEVDPLTGKSNIWHEKLFHPLDDWYGASPIDATAREIDTRNEANEWNKNLLANSGKPGMVFTFEGAIGDTEYNRLEQRLKNKYSGPRNIGKHLIIEGKNATVTPWGFTPQEMDFIESNREMSRNICLGFGVPPLLLGIPGDNTYSNYEQACLSFWETTVFFYMRRFGHGFSHFLFDQDEKIHLQPDLDSIPALEPRRESQWAKAEKADFATLNEKRRMVGLEKYKSVLEDVRTDDDPADFIYQQVTMAPISDEPFDNLPADRGGEPAALATPPAGEDDTTNPKLPGGKPNGQNPGKPTKPKKKIPYRGKIF